MTTLNKAQLEILRQFEWCKKEEDFQDLRKLLTRFWLDRAIENADNDSIQKGYTRETFEGFMGERMRGSSTSQ